MYTLRIKRSRASNVDPKQALRTYVDQLPVEKQHEFVEAAFQLMGSRIDLSKVAMAPTRELVS